MPYTLRNGVVIKDIAWAPPVISPGSAPRAVYKAVPEDSRWTYSTAEIDPESGIVLMPCIRFSISVKLDAASKANTTPDSFRLMQLVRNSGLQFQYSGIKAEDGFVNLAFNGALLETMLDCLTNPQATAAIDAPYYTGSDNTMATSDGYFLSLVDSPGSTVPIYVFNPRGGTQDPETKKTNGRRNLLQSYLHSLEFLSILTFKHRDGTREVLEGWRWYVDRSATFQWKGTKIDTRGPPTSAVRAGPFKEVLFGVFDVEPYVRANKVVNIVGNAALSNPKTDANVSYLELKENPGVPADFWTQ